MNALQKTLKRQNHGRPPVWLMRQAGRYHSHYQALKQKHTFLELCKQPELACEATLGPMRDFGFDAAILFSDLLFPLEVMGTGLEYDPGPKLGRHLRERADLEKLDGGAQLASQLSFQAQALELIRKSLFQEFPDEEKGLLGFVGGPLTLFCYAVEGSHQGSLSSAREGLHDGRWEGFLERLEPLLIENMVLQAHAGADTVAVLDTCVGEFNPEIYEKWIIPSLSRVLHQFKEKQPGTPIVYYSKGTGPEHWEKLKGLPIDCLGMDWKQDLAEVLRNWGETYAIQGNIDPHWLFLEPSHLEAKLRKVWGSVKELPAHYRRGWICGLGHGVMPKTPEENVRLFLKIQKEMFSCKAEQ